MGGDGCPVEGRRRCNPRIIFVFKIRKDFKLPGEEAQPDRANHRDATKNNPLVGLGGASPNLRKMSSSHSQRGQRECCSLPECSDKCTLEDNGPHPDAFSFLPFTTTVQL